jgi:hypothetical protein
MTTEVEDICRSLDWPFQIFDAKEAMSAELMNHLGLSSPQQGFLSYCGIMFKPDPESEWVYLTFLEDQLVPPINLQFVDQLTNRDDFFTAFSKTQFAGPIVHAAIIKLMKYLDGKYLTFSRFIDETGFWDSGDLNALNQSFARMDFLLNKVDEALADIHISNIDVQNDLLSKIEAAIRNLPENTYIHKMNPNK